MFEKVTYCQGRPIYLATVKSLMLFTIIYLSSNATLPITWPNASSRLREPQLQNTED